MLREGIDRSQELIEAILGYARMGELRSEQVALARPDGRRSRGPAPQPVRGGRDADVGELPELSCDPRQLRRVLQNLVGNAVKFRGEAPPEVEVSALRGARRVGRHGARQRRRRRPRPVDADLRDVLARRP